jgi:hypothetical protein
MLDLLPSIIEIYEKCCWVTISYSKSGGYALKWLKYSGFGEETPIGRLRNGSEPRAKLLWLSNLDAHTTIT